VRYSKTGEWIPAGAAQPEHSRRIFSGWWEFSLIAHRPMVVSHRFEKRVPKTLRFPLHLKPKDGCPQIPPQAKRWVSSNFASSQKMGVLKFLLCFLHGSPATSPRYALRAEARSNSFTISSQKLGVLKFRHSPSQFKKIVINFLKTLVDLMPSTLHLRLGRLV